MDIQSQAESILRKWALEFHDSGDFVEGISIVQDGYLTDDDGNEDHEQPCYAIFVHHDSLGGSFPLHKQYGNVVAHRPSEEVCFYVWLDISSGEDQEINVPETGLDPDVFYQMIVDIEAKCHND